MIFQTYMVWYTTHTDNLNGQKAAWEVRVCQQYGDAMQQFNNLSGHKMCKAVDLVVMTINHKNQETNSSLLETFVRGPEKKIVYNQKEDEADDL